MFIHIYIHKQFWRSFLGYENPRSYNSLMNSSHTIIKSCCWKIFVKLSRNICGGKKKTPMKNSKIIVIIFTIIYTVFAFTRSFKLHFQFSISFLEALHSRSFRSKYSVGASASVAIIAFCFYHFIRSVCLPAESLLYFICWFISIFNLILAYIDSLRGASLLPLSSAL